MKFQVAFAIDQEAIEVEADVYRMPTPPLDGSRGVDIASHVQFFKTEGGLTGPDAALLEPPVFSAPLGAVLYIRVGDE